MIANSGFTKIAVLHIIAVIFTVFNLTNIKLMPNFIPLFDIMIIYYFTVYRNAVFSWWFLFLLGVWDDSLSGIPIGITSLCYIAAVRFFYILNQRLVIRENFKQIWQQFVVFAFCILLLKWLLLSAYNKALYDIAPAMTQLVISAILYVIMHKFFDYLSQKLLSKKYNAQGL